MKATAIILFKVQILSRDLSKNACNNVVGLRPEA
jgi:hypothetical protein